MTVLKRILLSIVVCLVVAPVSLEAGKFPWCCCSRRSASTSPVDEVVEGYEALAGDDSRPKDGGGSHLKGLAPQSISAEALPVDASLKVPVSPKISPMAQRVGSTDSSDSISPAGGSPLALAESYPVPAEVPVDRSTLIQELGLNDIKHLVKVFLVDSLDFRRGLLAARCFDLAGHALGLEYMCALWCHAQNYLHSKGLPSDDRTVARVMRLALPHFLDDATIGKVLTDEDFIIDADKRRIIKSTGDMGIITGSHYALLMLFWGTMSDRCKYIARVYDSRRVVLSALEYDSDERFERARARLCWRYGDDVKIEKFAVYNGDYFVHPSMYEAARARFDAERRLMRSFPG